MNKNLPIGKYWNNYVISPEADHLTLNTDEYVLEFVGIHSLKISPVSKWAQDEELKDIDFFYEADLRVHDPEVGKLFRTDLKMHAARVGEEPCAVYICGSRDLVKHYRGFRFSGDEIDFALLCTRFEMKAVKEEKEHIPL